MGLLGLSGGMTAAFLSAAIFTLSIVISFYLRENFVISQLAALTIIFLAILGVTPIVSSFFYDIQSVIILRLLAEVAVVVFIFFATYNFIRIKVISPRFFLYSIAVLGLLASLVTLKDIIGANVIRRVATISGVNYVGTTFAMSAITWMMIIYNDTFTKSTSKKITTIKIASLTLVFFAMLFTGTRSATVAFIVGLIILQLFGMKSKKFKKYIIVIALILVFLITIIAFNVDLSRLWSRYSFEQLQRMAMIRFNIYASSVTDMTLLEFFVGRPDFYIFSSDDGARMINTHNLFLSLIRYHGIFVFILCVALLLVMLINYFKLNLVHKNQPLYRITESSIIVLFSMALVYTMFSGGRPTRAFSLFIMLGYFAGYFELLKNVESVEEYKKMIL
jgi:hypothetical protein